MASFRGCQYKLWKGRRAHNIAFYFMIEICGDLEIPENGDFVSQKDNCDVVIGWMPIEKIPDVTIYPGFLKEEIHQKIKGCGAKEKPR